jgi:hypothetical protein
MEKLPLEIKGMIFSYLDSKQILTYMKWSKNCCYNIKKFSKYIGLERVVIGKKKDIFYYTDMKIKMLNLYRMNDADLKLITEHIKRIENIFMTVCYQISDDGLKYIKDIQSVRISYDNKMTDDGLAHLQNIKQIMILDNKNITGAGLRHLSNIYNVSLFLCKNINDEGLEYLKNVHTVSIISYENITNNGIKKLNNVKYLQLICINITDDCLKHLGNVEVLDIRNNSLITDDGLQYLSNINFLKIVNCKNITIKGINKLLETRLKLIWIIDDTRNNGAEELHYFDYN